LLGDAGLVEGEEEGGIRSAVGNFLQEVDISGVASASYNYRFIDQGDQDGLGDTTGLGDGTPPIPNGGASNDTFFTHPNADTFQLDQLWVVVEKVPTEESRGGFHADFVWGETAESQSSGTRDSGLLYTGYASYLAPIGNGVQIDAGKLATPLGAEVLQANQNFNVTNGVVFQNLQPFTHSGVAASTELMDGVGLIVGVVNEVYRDTSISTDRDKAYYAQLAFSGDSFGLNIGAIVGEDPTSARCDNTESDCNTSVVDVTATFNPSDSVEAWVDFDWVRNFGSDAKDGDKFGIAAASRVAVTDETSLAGRVEYLHENAVTLASLTGPDRRLFTLTGTVDQKLTDGLHVRGEVRWDKEMSKRASKAASGNSDQLVGLLEMYYAF